MLKVYGRLTNFPAPSCSGPGEAQKAPLPAAMEAADCPFSQLPCGLLHYFLTEAFKQMDFSHQQGISPLVCRQWKQLALLVCSSLDIELPNARSFRDFACWLRKFGERLEAIKLVVVPIPSCSSLLQPIGQFVQLRSLSLHSSLPAGGYNTGTLDADLSPLTNLTTLSLHQWMLEDCIILSLPSLTQLRSLALVQTMPCGYGAGAAALDPIVPKISTSLEHITRLDLTGSDWAARGNLGAVTALTGLSEFILAEAGLYWSQFRPIQHLPSLCPSFLIVFKHDDVQEVAAWIGSCGSRLESLDVVSYQFSPALPEDDLQQIISPITAKCFQLRHLGFSYCQLPETASQLRDLPKLASLFLQECIVSSSVQEQLSTVPGFRVER